MLRLPIICRPRRPSRLSQRPAPGSAAAEPRCFCRMLICNGYQHTVTPYAWSAAQAVAATYLPPALPATPPQQQGEDQPPAAEPASPPQQQQPAVRRVVFHRRGTQIRQFVNLPELVSRCGHWRWPAAAGNTAAALMHVECSTHTFSDLADSVAAAQEADVFIGTHGANIANGEQRRGGRCHVVGVRGWRHGPQGGAAARPTAALFGWDR